MSSTEAWWAVYGRESTDQDAPSVGFQIWIFLSQSPVARVPAGKERHFIENMSTVWLSRTWNSANLSMSCSLNILSLPIFTTSTLTYYLPVSQQKQVP